MPAWSTRLPQSGPRVVIDESHRNFHTASGRYRPFAQLIGNDGYRVEPGREVHPWMASGMATSW